MEDMIRDSGNRATNRIMAIVSRYNRMSFMGELREIMSLPNHGCICQGVRSIPEGEDHMIRSTLRHLD